MTKARVLLLSVLFVGLAFAGSSRLSLGQKAELPGDIIPLSRRVAHGSSAGRGFPVEISHGPGLEPGAVPDLAEEASHASAASVGLRPIRVAAQAWQTETVDSAGAVGLFTSLALDVEDRPHISYQAYGVADLKYAHHDGSAWVSETVEDTGAMGAFTSLALASTGRPHIGYCGSVYISPITVTLVKYAAYDGSAWITETVDSVGQTGGYTSLALDSGDRPCMSYFDSSTAGLMYAHRDGGDWVTETVDSAGDGGGYTSLALDGDDHPHISYYHGPDGDLKYARWTGATWISETVDSTGDVGLYTSLALDKDNQPHIAYCLGGAAAAGCTHLKYAYYSGTAWVTATVAEGDTLEYTSLALDAAGLPRIAYRDFRGLRYAYYDGAAWSAETVDGGEVGRYPSLALDSSGYPHVSYHDQPGSSLRYAEYDLTSPTIISGPAVVSITQDSAVVVWQTDEESDSVVQVGDQAATYDRQVQDPALFQDHALKLTSLAPSTVYHYFVQSTDGSSNTVASVEGFFETAPLSDSEPPVASSLAFERDPGLYDLYRFSASVSDTIGVARVEFYMDDELIGVDYAPSSPAYEAYMHPFVQGIAREDFFTSHEMRVVAYDHAGLSGVQQQTIIPFEEPMEGELRIELPHQGYIEYIEGNTVPAGTEVNIVVYAVEYEWASILDLFQTNPVSEEPHEIPHGPFGLQAARPEQPAGPFAQVPGVIFGQELYGIQVDRAVDRVVFSIDDTPVYTSVPDHETDFYHSYVWDISGMPTGTHKIAATAYDTAGKQLYRARHMGIKRGTPAFDLSRSVSRIGNYFRVSLTLTNEGTASAEVDRMIDNVYGFQPIRRDLPLGADPSYEVITWCSLDVIHCDVVIDLRDTAGDSITLGPGESATVEYDVVPILYTYSFQYAIGPYDVAIQYDDATGYHEQEITRPCYSTEEGELNPVAWAKAEANYLIVTNPAYLSFQSYPVEGAVELLLSELGRLAQLKSGILGYVAGDVANVADPNWVDGWITQWGTGMMGSDGAPNGFLSNGYLLLVGETEIIPAHSKHMNPPSYASYAHSLHIDTTDMYYANTGGNSFNPELMVGRIIGNVAWELVVPIQSSISVFEGRPNHDFDRSHALVVSGWDECREGGCDDINFSDEAAAVDSRLTNGGTQVVRLDTPQYVSQTQSVAAFLSLAPGQDIIHLVGHGNSGSCDDLEASDVTSPTDPFGDAHPFVYGSSCLTGRYTDGPSFAEAFLTRGAGVYLGSTEVSYCCTNKAVAKKFYDRWDSGESIAYALKQTKVDIGSYNWKKPAAGYYEDIWTAEYHLFGDPKFGLGVALPPRQSTSQVSQKTQVAAGPVSSLDVVVPAYEITTTVEGETFVEIPGGFAVMAPGKPLVPLYDVIVEYPKGTSVQDVVMTSRSGLSTTTGLNVPSFAPAESGCGCGCTTAAIASTGWWPESDFDWSIEESPVGTSTLRIRIYPFFYNPQTTDVKFYQNYSFEIETMTTTVEVSLLTTDEDEYAQGEVVSIELWVSNSGAAQDVIVDAVVKDGSTGELVDGLPLRSLKNLTGVSSFSYPWDSGGFDPGQYIVEVEVRDGQGNLLDQAMTGFMLGIFAGKVTTFTATPESFDVGDTISITLVFSNTGTVPISGTTVFKVLSESGELVQTLQRTFSGLAPGSDKRFDADWDTSGTEVGTFSIVGYTLYGGRSSGGAVVVSSMRWIYLPIVLRDG
jgi:uncharacterized repeat protein (TIGR01451 family)